MKITSWLWERKGLVVLVLIYGAIFLLMRPIYNKAYDDDFAYAQSVRHLVLDRQFVISQWAAVPLVFQILWGGLFSFLFGFSFVTLTVSTLVLLAFGLVAFYLTCRLLGADDFLGMILSLVLLSFPWTLLFAFSFLSNIPYLSLFLISIYFYLCGLKKLSNKSLFWGSIFAFLAFLTRQTGIVLLPAVLAAMVLGRFPRRSFLFAASLPVLGLLVYFLWLSMGHQTFSQWFAMEHVFWPTKILSMGVGEYVLAIVGRFGYYVSIIGAPLLPLFLLVLPGFLREGTISKKRFLIPWIIASIVVFLSFFGPLYLDDFAINIKEVPVPETPFFFTTFANVFRLFPHDLYRQIWTIFVVFSVPFVTGMIVMLAVSLRSKPSTWKTFLLVSFFLLFVWTLVLPTVWPEYTLSLMPFILLGILVLMKNLSLSREMATFTVLTMLFFSFLNAKVTHSVKGLLWQSSEGLVASGADPKDIKVDMFSWYPWWEYEKTFDQDLSSVGWNMRRLARLRSWRFPIEDPKYVVDFEPGGGCGSHLETFWFAGDLCLWSVSPEGKLRELR